MLAPFAPYTAQDLWAELGHKNQCSGMPGRRSTPELAKDDLVEIPVQVNGKLRGHVHAPHGASKEDLEKLAFANEKVKPFVQASKSSKWWRFQIV